MSHSMSALPPKLPAEGTTAGAAAVAGAAAGAAAGADAAAAPPAASSSISSSEPSPTLSPTFTFNSLTTPAADEGISMLALSDSTVIRDWSALMVSPGLTMISMISTSLKSPMLGTLISIVLISALQSQQGLAQVAEDLGQVGGEARAHRAIDDAVVVGQRQGQHQAGLEGCAIPHRFHGRLRQAEDGHFRCVDDRREIGAADAAQRGDGERGTLHVGRFQ